ncbi:MAG: hypothetical protein ACFFG0_14455 [Candidatus Thorarchaeota archaeon]
MTVKKIEHRLEQLIDRISIKSEKEKYIKGQIKYFTRHLKVISQSPIRYYYNSYTPSLDYEFIQFEYGGSFDRNTCINQRYDIDAYLIFQKKSFGWNYISINDLRGGHLFEMVRNQLGMFNYHYGNKIQVLKDFPYTHAIPIKVESYV